MSDRKPDADFWERVCRKNADVVSRKIAGELFLVPVRGKIADMQRIFTLNPVGELIWQDIDEGKTLAEIRDHLLSAYDVPRETITTHIREFVAELLDAKLIACGNVGPLCTNEPAPAQGLQRGGLD